MGGAAKGRTPAGAPFPCDTMNISPEVWADTVADTLLRDLPAALAAQTALFADRDLAAGRTIELDAPAAKDFYIGGVGAVTSYPTFEVAVPDLNVLNFNLGQSDGDVEFTLIVRFWLRSASVDVLYRKVGRFVAATASVLTVPGAISDATIASIRGAWRFNPETGDLDAVISGALLAFSCESVLRR
jgi:hypothetical protein